MYPRTDQVYRRYIYECHPGATVTAPASGSAYSRQEEPFVTTQPGTGTNLAWLRSRDGDRLQSAM